MSEMEPNEKDTGVGNPNFRIKTLEELNQSRSKYEGMITYFREDGVMPAPMKSVEELNRVHDKAPIYYGRDGEKYGAFAELTEESRQSLKLDENGKMPEEDKADREQTDSSDSMGYSVNGLNMEYLSSLLEETEGVEEEEAQGADGLSGDQLRIQQAILEEAEQPKAAASEVTVSELSKTDQSKPKMPKSVVHTAENKTTVSSGSARIGRAALIQRQLEEGKQPVEPKAPPVLSRAEYARMNSTSNPDRSMGGPTLSKSEDEPVIVKEKRQITFGEIIKELLVYAFCIVIALVLSIVIVKFVGQKTEVSGDSMNDTLVNGQQLIIDKLSYRFDAPKRYDVVVFPENEKSNYVKRIIGMPGETVSIEEGYIYINGELLADDIYGKEPVSKDKYYRLSEPVTLGDDEYFVLGDNRNNSTDSRDVSVGNISRERIIGKVVFRIWPLNKMGTVH